MQLIHMSAIGGRAGGIPTARKSADRRKSTGGRIKRGQNLLRDTSGQALVSLLVFSVIAIAVTTTAISVTINTSQATQAVENKVYIQHAAQSGIENALLRFLRDPSYSGETITINDVTVITTVEGSGPYTITATATNSMFTHTQQAVVTYNNTILTIASWTDTY